MRISVIVPSKGCTRLKYLFLGLKEQSIRPSEVILVLKGCNVKRVEDLCGTYGLPCAIIEQERGYFTHALNMGKREADGDLLVFTDDDAIPPRRWLERWIKYHELYRRAAGISSRDFYLDLSSFRIFPTPDDLSYIKLYRWLIRPLLEKPHPLLKKYRLGVYITRNYSVAHGPYIPSKTCYSLPFRGVNMSFKAEYVYDVWFPEHPLLKRASGNEQYFGLQLILKGYDTIYVPHNPVLHIARRGSLSRTKRRSEVRVEAGIMREFYKKLLKSSVLSI